MPNSCPGLAPDHFCSRSVKLEGEDNFYRGSRETFLCVDTQAKPANRTATTGDFECEVSVDTSHQLHLFTYFCTITDSTG